MQLRLSAIVVLLLLTFGLGLSSPACAAQSEESQLKAVFVLNFAKLTEWPADARSDNTTFTIAILGKSPTATFISMLREQTVHGLQVAVKHVDNVRQAKDAQLIFVSDSERQRLPGILKELHQTPILTVSDIAGFCEAGGMIGLIPVQNRLSFEVNVIAVRKGRLTLSSQLLKLAKVLHGQ